MLVLRISAYDGKEGINREVDGGLGHYGATRELATNGLGLVRGLRIGGNCAQLGKSHRDILVIQALGWQLRC